MEKKLVNMEDIKIENVKRNTKGVTLRKGEFFNINLFLKSSECFLDLFLINI